MANWQPIATAPKDGTEVLISGHAFNHPGRGRYVTTAIWCADDLWRHEDDIMNYLDDDQPCGGCHPPTHWMPLPEAPKDE